MSLLKKQPAGVKIVQSEYKEPKSLKDVRNIIKRLQK